MRGRLARDTKGRGGVVRDINKLREKKVKGEGERK
jgi:hypothetical protein